jgi:hypothetical protein
MAWRDDTRDTPGRMTDFLENYDEVVAAVGGSQFAEYLAD